MRDDRGSIRRFYQTKQRALATDNAGGRRGLWRKA